MLLENYKQIASSTFSHYNENHLPYLHYGDTVYVKKELGLQSR